MYLTSRKKRLAQETTSADPAVKAIEEYEKSGRPQRRCTEVHAEQQTRDEQRAQADRRIGHLRQRGGERQHFAREIDLRHQVRVASQAVDREPESADEEGPGNGLHRNAHYFLGYERPAADERHGDAHQRTGRDDEDRHEDRPCQPHHRLLVANSDIAPHQLVEQPAVSPQLVTEDEAQVAKERSPLLQRQEPVVVCSIVRARLVRPGVHSGSGSGF